MGLPRSEESFVPLIVTYAVSSGRLEVAAHGPWLPHQTAFFARLSQIVFNFAAIVRLANWL